VFVPNCIAITDGKWVNIFFPKKITIIISNQQRTISPVSNKLMIKQVSFYQRWLNPKANAPSVPGLTSSQAFASFAKGVGRGSTTISFAPLFRPVPIALAWASQVFAGYAPKEG
jgi:hypothetical protein